MYNKVFIKYALHYSSVATLPVKHKCKKTIIDNKRAIGKRQRHFKPRSQ